VEPTELHSLGRDFFVLLMLPTLGVLGLMHRRAIPVLRWTLIGWTVFGLGALLTGHTFSWSAGRFLRLWLLGVALGAAFLGIAVLRNNRRVKPWLKVGLALLTLLAFARALLLFLERHA
jgi:hypothetical protein